MSQGNRLHLLPCRGNEARVICRSSRGRTKFCNVTQEAALWLPDLWDDFVIQHLSGNPAVKILVRTLVDPLQQFKNVKLDAYFGDST